MGCARSRRLPEVRLSLDAENEIVAVITHDLGGSPGPAIGMEISALVKSSSVLLLNDPQVRTSARNHLWGRDHAHPRWPGEFWKSPEHQERQDGLRSHHTHNSV
ncbi:MAG: hypothetical protein IPJ27_12130 [Candidatus Accumulibacter sp.]|uniref:Uncharacterized protein n=1 Tax=Candidatus Accumulibacter proximus TaxID=2954385 RepID=A0A935PZX8_9PROT|nr:hypothetical protein [Candidatus Accumulibacter proximus]